MAKLNEFQRRYLSLFERHVDVETGEIFDKEFEQDIIKLRSMGASILKKDPEGNEWEILYPPLYRLILKYELPHNLDRFLYIFIVNDSIEPKHIRPSISLVSDSTSELIGESIDPNTAYNLYQQYLAKNGNELKIIIEAGTSIQEIKDFLLEHGKEIRRMQNKLQTVLDSERLIRPYQNAKRDYRIVQLHREGRKDAEIADIVNKEYRTDLTYKEVWAIRKRLQPKDIPV